MNYKNIKMLLFAADQAYQDGFLTRHQYLKILDDCENNLDVLNNMFLEKNTTAILLEYMKL